MYIRFKNKKKKFFACNLVASAIFCIASFWFILNVFYMVDFPFSDDYKVILIFMNNFIGEKNLIKKIILIFEGYQGHCLCISRVIVLLDYFITGCLNFNFICIFSNFTIFSIFYILYKAFHWYDQRVFFFSYRSHLSSFNRSTGNPASGQVQHCSNTGFFFLPLCASIYS